MLLRATLPAVSAALSKVPNSQARFIIVTDSPAEVMKWFDLNRPEFKSVRFLPKPTQNSAKPATDKYLKLGVAMRQIMQEEAAIDECVSILTADAVISSDWFETAGRYFAQGKKLFVNAGVRSCGDPPIGVSAAELNRWAWEHRHHANEDCVWGRGHSLVPSQLFFEKNGSVVGRGFHLNTLTFRKKNKEIGFSSLTPDGGKGCFASSSFTKEDVQFICRADEMAIVGLTPPDIRWPSGPPLSVDGVAGWARKASEWERWLFATHRRYFVGNGDADDEEVCNTILARLSIG